MTRVQFLNDLYHHLHGMTREQAEQHLTYYAEMLADRIEEGMSEEEAVASMESVETIARRILEEEGLPYTPPEKPLTPPAYPDASKLEGGGGTRGYQVPKKWNGRKLLQTALWAVAALAVVSALGRWAWQNHVRDRAYSSDPVEEVAPIDTTPYEYGGDDMEPYEEGFTYAGDAVPFSCDYLEKLEIHWASGMVHVQSWDGGGIQIQEHSTTALNERTQMAWQEEDGKVTVQYRKSGGAINMKGSKWLTVLVPDGMLGELDIETASAEVRLYGVEAASMTAETASGQIQCYGCYANEVDLGTVSGDVTCNEVTADELKIGTTSGDIYGDSQIRTLSCETISGYTSITARELMEQAELHSTSGNIYLSAFESAARTITADSTSGDVGLSLPFNMGFTLEYDTVSGDLFCENFELSRQGDQWVCNGGGCEIEVGTVSGDLEIH